MEFRILGPLEVVAEGRPLNLGGGKQRAVLGALLLEAGRVVPAERLQELLWGDERLETAGHVLQVHISQLRRALEPDHRKQDPYRVLVSQAPGYRLVVAPVSIDMFRFQSHVARAQEASATHHDDEAIAHLDEGLKLWHGPLLADLEETPLLARERARVEELRLHALEERLEAHLRLNRHAEVIGELEALAQESPLRERLQGLLMLGLYRSGRQADASAIFQRTRRRLNDELGMEPGPALQKLLKQILNHDISLEVVPTAKQMAGPNSLHLPFVGRRRALCRVLVGREEELSTLEDALLAAYRGAGSVVVLAGDAGIGKSRMCRELAVRASRIGAAVMEGSCSEADLALPYLPFVEAIGNQLSLGESAGWRSRLGVHARELARVFPQLDDNEPPTTESESPDRRLRLFEAFLALLSLASQDGGLLLIVEDLHWADASTRELLDYLTRRLSNSRILLLATYRRDEIHRKHPLLPAVQGWHRSGLAQQVELEALPSEGVAKMVSSIFDDTTVGDDFRDFMHRRSEGNPFVLEEMLKAAIDRGDIYRDEADWQRKPIAELKIPDTVRDTILLRVERLPSGQAQILQCAAVLGRSFDYQILIRLSEQDRLAVEAALQTAVQQQLLEEEPGARNQYRFRHALTQEAIYDDLSAPTRERLHSAAADVLAETPEAARAEVAFHLRSANRWQEAVEVTMEAAAGAEARLGYGEAAALYSLLLPVVRTGVARARLLCQLGEAYYQIDSPGRALGPLEEGIALLEQAGEVHEAARYRLTFGRCKWETSDSAQARPEYERSLRVLEPAGPSRDLALGYIRLAGLHAFNYEFAAAQELADKAISTADKANAPDMRIWAYNFLGVAIAYRGDYPAGIEYLERSAAEALDRGLYDIAGNALHNLCDCYLGNLEHGKLLGLARRLEEIKLERYGLSSLWVATAYFHVTGNLAAALKVGQETLARSSELDDVNIQLGAHRLLGLILVELDRLDEARGHLSTPGAQLDAQYVVEWAWLWLHFHLAAGDITSAVEGAEVLLRCARPAAKSAAAIAAIEVFIKAGRLDDAERMQAELEGAPAPIDRLVASLGRARTALARGNATRSAVEVAEAIQVFEKTGLVLSELHGRLLLGELHEHDHNATDAAVQYRLIVKAAGQRGLPRLERLAREGLARLGITVDTPAAAASETEP